MAQVKRSHPTPDQLAAFISGRLGEAASAEIKAHLADCDKCGRLLDTVPIDTPISLLSDSSTGVCSLVPVELADHPRYRILELLGRGGMGTVYKAEHRLMERLVALKVISRSLTEKPAAVERFRREVKAAARLLHPNIVTAYDAEQAGDAHFLVMEFVAGLSLARLVTEQGPLPLGQACGYARQAALGMQHGYEQGMVHRDIKPQNLMLAFRSSQGGARGDSVAGLAAESCRAPVAAPGVIKILDFGLARFFSESGPEGDLTEPGLMMGTADYIAPEQARDAHTADIRADIYGLGCTLYHLLAGHPPFPGGKFIQKVLCHLERTPTPLTELRPDIPSDVARVVERMMAKDLSHRFQTPAEVASALLAFIEPVEFEVASSDRRMSHPAENFAQARGIPKPRNPFGVSDAHDPEGADVKEFAVQVQLDGGPDDPNALPWSQRPAKIKPGSLDGLWSSRWNGGKAGAGWINGSATIKTVAGRVYILFKDPTNTYLIDTRRDGSRLVGRSTNLEDLTESSPWVGLVVDLQRIDGKWPHGRWDLRRNLVGGYERYTLRGHAGRVVSLAFSPDGQTLGSASLDRTVRLWDVGTGAQQHAFALLQSDKQVLLRHDATTGEQRRTLVGHSDQALSVAFSQDGQTLASGGGYDSVIRLRDVASGKERRSLERHQGPVGAVAFSPDGQTLASGSEDQTSILWDLPTGQVQQTLSGHAGPVRCVAFSPDGLALASGSFDQTVKLWDTQTGQLLRTLGGHSDRVLAVAFTPDGQTLVSGTHDQTVRCWNPANGELRGTIASNRGVAHSLALSPDGRMVAIGSDAVRLFHVETGEERCTLMGHLLPVTCVAFSPDSRVLASGSVDQTVRIWDLNLGS